MSRYYFVPFIHIVKTQLAPFLLNHVHTKAVQISTTAYQIHTIMAEYEALNTLLHPNMSLNPDFDEDIY